MQLSVLGPVLAIGHDSTPTVLGGPQQRRLLCALAAHCPLPVSKDTLEDLLWPGGAPSNNALQAQISKLRRALAPTEITAVTGGYALDLERSALDAASFEHTVTAGRDAAAATDMLQAAAHFAHALSLWRGVPYAEAADHYVAQAASARLTSLRDTALTGRIEADLAAGRADEVAGELEALVRESPLDEHWWALLAIAHYRRNRQSEALRTISEARRVLADEVGLEPGPELRELEAKVLAHDPSLGTGDRPRPSGIGKQPHLTSSRLPQRLSSFIGRTNELEALEHLVASSRLVTLVGPGGSGKTSTSIELARRLAAGRSSTEAALVELAQIVNGTEVIASLAAALNVPSRDRTVSTDTEDATDGLADIIGDREMLLVIDNCEHVIDEAARLTHTLLSRCANLRVVATSREPLDVPGESIWSIPPLDPEEAVDLFVARAEATGTGFVLDESNRAKVDALLARLDGLPLAIELAAARLRSLALVDVINRLDDRFAVLNMGPRTVQPRQQTLRAVVDWSHDLLDCDERTVFRRLGAFAGGATVDAVTAVCADTNVSAAAVPEIIERLAHKSLVVADRGVDGVRFRMLQTLQDYAVERLAEAGETEAIRRRHARYFADLIAPAERGLMGPEQAHWIAVLTAERENLAIALGHAIALQDADLALELVTPVGWYFFMVADVPLGVDWLREALSCPGPADPRRRAFVLGMFSWLAVTSTEIQLAAGAAGEAMSMLGSFDDAWTECMVICTAAMTRLFLGETAEFEYSVELARQAAERTHDRWTHGLVAIIEAQILLQNGFIADVDRAYADAIDAVGAAGDQFLRTIAITQAAELAEIQGDYDRAIRALEESLPVADQVGFSAQLLAVQARLANLEALRGNLGLASELHSAVLGSDAAVSSPWLRAVSLSGLAMIARRRDDAVAAAQLLDEAWALPRTQAVPLMRTLVLTARGYSADQLGDVKGAMEYQLMSLVTARQLGGGRVIANAFEGLAGAYALAGDGQLAAELLGCADGLRRATGGPMPPAERFDVDRAERRTRALIGDDAFETAFAGAAETDPELLFKRVLQA